MKQLLILGGGASGLCAAIRAADACPDADITVVECLDRVGKKILATGNGRCNLGNRDIAARNYHTAYPSALDAFLAQMPPQRTTDFFASLGLLTTADSAGRIYPYCRQATMVLDVLLRALERRSIRLACAQRVTSLRREKGAYLAATQEGRQFRADAVILATGGRAAPKQGGLGIGFDLAAALGHTVVDTAPCLAPLTCDHPALRALKGIRAHCDAILLHGASPVHTEHGEIQFTDYGLSGIPAMDLSALLSGAEDVVSLDLLPDWSTEALAQLFRERAQAEPQASLEQITLGTVHKRVMATVLRSAGLGAGTPAAGCTPGDWMRLGRTLKDWRFPVTGTLGWDQAQTTRGGVPLSEVDEHFASVLQPRLYLTGELLDVAGDCGGYNLHWAWCSGLIAGEAAARALAQLPDRAARSGNQNSFKKSNHPKRRNAT